MLQPRLLCLLWLLLAPPTLGLLKERTCCKYALQRGSEGSEGNPTCSDPQGCILRDPQRGSLSSPHLSQCTAEDQKIGAPVGAAEEACKETLTSEPTPVSSGLPFSLVPYAFRSESAKNLSGVEVRWNPNSDSRIDYRMFSSELCQEGSGLCRPRCVSLALMGGPGSLSPNTEVVQDCEVGFYVFNGTYIRETAGHVYQMDWCTETCHSGLFTMPHVSSSEAPLMMLDRVALTRDKKVVVLLPPSVKETEVTVQILHRDGDVDEWASHEETVPVVDSRASLGSLPSERGYFKVSVSGLGDAAEFSLDDSPDPALSVSLVVGSLLLLAGAAAFSYYRYTVVRNVVVSPNRLLDSGRCKPKSVFIITNVDNRHHVDIVLAFSKYLKSHCGVGEVYFALDSRTGVTSQPEHDPWKWAQHVTELMASSEDSCLVFIGAPPPALGLPIFKDLPNNQAFVGAQYLKGMADGGRVAVLHFPYSDPGTVPTLVPAHLRAKAHAVPKRFNDFLCQLLDVKKRELCACLPIPLVKPQIAPKSIPSFHGGKELTELIDNLTAKVDLHKAELKAAAANGTLSRTSEAFSDSEERGLLRAKAAPLSQAPPLAKKKEATPLEIDLEPGVMSLRGKEAEERDRSVNPEFQNNV